jgi:hypothetical protein
MASKHIPVTKEEIDRLQKLIAEKLTQPEKDRLLASLIISMDRVGSILKDFVTNKDVQLTKSQEKEIEDIVSIGPTWLNYTKKIRRKTTDK